MRLINTETLQIHEFIDADNAPEYVILSHCWGDSELSFQDYTERGIRTGQRYTKIRKCCSLAKREDYEWVWIDTCCIDKRSSAELSEAINSMYRWYQSAAVCFVYLHDVTATLDDRQALENQLRNSRWFTRGWTLQELVAPRSVMVLNNNWQTIGKPRKLRDPFDLHFDEVPLPNDEDFHWIRTMTLITGIPPHLIGSGIEPDFYSDCTANRLSWMQTRQTTRSEDLGYCLLGLLGINMPLLYGEGDKAFFRVQLETLNQTGDESILAFSFRTTKVFSSTGSIDFFACEPADFRESRHIELRVTHDRPPIVMTSRFAEIRPTSRYAGVYNHRTDASLILVRLNCAQATGQRLLSPCIIFLRSLYCGHLVREPVPSSKIQLDVRDLHDLATCCEEDLLDSTEWEPLASTSDRTLLVHLTGVAAGICRLTAFRSKRNIPHKVQFRLQSQDD